MIEVKVFNSLTNKVEILKTIKPNEVSMYVCGPTVYNDAHIGNFRPAVFFDVLRRFLTYIGYKVTYVSNFTDVDDKIIKRAAELKISEKELTDQTIQDYLKVLDSLNVLRATANPRVSETMDEIIAYIDNLVKNGSAYVSGNDVYFRINSLKEYGLLSNIKLDELKSGARIEENDNKENYFDFTLWKKTDFGVNWDSPWGKGRPGWHTECVVMINKIMGNVIDIHGGGFDLKFPHHENEMAQSEATCHTHLANYWMHNGFVNINNEKMSKSLGNFITGKDAVSKYGGNLVRYLLLSTYYRSPINLCDQTIETAKVELSKIEKALNDVSKKLQILGHFNDNVEPQIDGFIYQLSQDINISNAMTEVFEAIKKINLDLRNRNTSVDDLVLDYVNLKTMVDILGLKFEITILTNEDLDLLKRYNDAKDNKDYELSDKLRAELIAKNLL